MSQWNNTFMSNNQYQNSSNLNGDPNSQYHSQNYYDNRQGDSRANQYVSFNEFISQMQVPTDSASYNSVQNPNIPNSQFLNVGNHQNDTSNQSNQLNYDYGASYSAHGNNRNEIQMNNGGQTNSAPNFTSEMVSKSKLTPTAVEFVPKSSFQMPTRNSKPREETSAENSLNEPNNKKQPESQNWRDRPSSSGHSSNTYNINGKDNQSKYFDKFETNRYHSRNNQTESNVSHTKNSKYENKNRKFDNNIKNKSDSNYQMSDNGDTNNQRRGKYDSYSNGDSNSRYSDNRDGNQRKSNVKVKNKDSDPRTFYNTKVNYQDRRNGKDTQRSKGRVGSQRLGNDYNSYEDEQYANSYYQYKDEVVKNSTASPSRHKKNPVPFAGNTEMTQRERLSEQLDKGTLECLVCCERVKQIDPVWHCSNCYHVMHLKCIRKWASSSVVEGKWRCPACQNTSEEIPTEYRCMCGAMRSPEYQRGGNGAHTCGKACKRPRSCPHPCTLLCHPGPCPACQATISKKCGCGAETRSVLCSSKLPQECGRKCDHLLNCEVHKCARDCHEGPCDPCQETVTQVCYCPAAKSRSVACTAESSREGQWSCEASCARVLACGAHVCRRECHPPPCDACPLRPGNVPTCPCGNTRLKSGERKSCTDPIPLCDNICAKPLECGPDGDKHFCKEKCHEGPCRVCPDTTLVQCRCGHLTRDIPCADYPSQRNEVFCQRKCNKKLSCGRHRCRATCCDSVSHRCSLVCGRSLSCQLHRCEALCHTGHCAPCPQLSFEELRCSCGAEVILPPVRCGTKPPACGATCARARACGHEPHHSCHAGDCPPCVVLTTKMCYGNHEERKTIPCSQEEFSCGLPCGKPLPCGKHTCIKTCHKGPCDTEKCKQGCREKRPRCGHECGSPCHADNGGVCPAATACRRPVAVTCPCLRRKATRACAENMRDYDKTLNALAATRIQEGGSVDISEAQRSSAMLKTLECDEECSQEARARQLALALQIRNPDVSAKLAPRYSDSLRAAAAREPAFAQHVHDKLTDLVQLAKKSKQKTRAHSFPSMNRAKRQFIHELCEHFGCESVAYDAEPNRNVVATADKEKSWLPAMSILEVLAREAGKRRVPGPVLRTSGAAATSSHTTKSSGGWATLTSTNAWAIRSQPSASTTAVTRTKPEPKPENKIDYFDNPPDN
ncbi:protein shuttle craft [Leptidea sinapis]|uniref:protein shuttle craft n=1 Tax=Leptidea sinapis TaxID=189913 RepID=UPI0021373404|nr:protein shuttle craft [Leptidea sinapis]